MTMTATLTFNPDITELDRWQTLSHYERHRILAAKWLALNPADAHARFAAAMGLLALVDEELAAAQATVDACAPLCALPDLAGAR